MFRRRPLLRAAVVGGGAYMAGKSTARRQDAETASTAAGAETEAAQPPVPSQRPAESSMPDQLNRLATLHQQGALTDDEFTAAKARLLGS